MLEASSDGRICRAVDSVNCRWKRGKGRCNAGYIFVPSIKESGYGFIRITIDGKRKHLFVHRLVCEAFHGKSDLQALHKNGVKSCNFPENLYWGTQKKNIEDRERHGKTMRGEKHYAAILSEKDVRKIKKLLRSRTVSQKAIAEKYGVTNFAISDIHRGKSWKHI